jgi:putative hydrolase of the HAD superfamily
VSHRALLPVRAVLFDFGHTLFDTADSIEFIERESAALGRPIPREVAERMWTDGRTRSRTPEEMAKGRDVHAEQHRACWLAIWTDLEALCPGLTPKLYEFETSAAGWAPFIDTRPVLDDLAALEVPMAVVSDTGWDLRPVFEHHGLASYFSTFVMSYQHGVTKPAPVLFHTACERLGVEPAEALMVGDNHRNDGGAIESGLRTLLLPLVPSGTERGLVAVLRLLGV